MARLPTRDDLGALPSARSGRVISAPDLTAIGRGRAALGEGIAQAGQSIGGAVTSRTTDVDQASRFEAQRRFLEFSAAQEEELTQSGQTAEPGAFGFREGFQQTYQKAAKDFFATIPDALKPEYDVKLFQAEDSLAGRALTFERTQRKDYYTNTVNDGLLKIENKLYENPSAFDDNLKEGDTFINSIPDEDVSPIEKEDMRRQWKKKAQVASLGGMPPKARMEALGAPAAAVGPLPPDVQGRASLARDHFVKLGYTPEQAAGIVGNLVQESGVRSDGAVGDQGTAFGMAQWRGERLTRLKRFAAANGREWNDFTTQLNFIDMELKNHETGAYQALKSAKTVDEATAAFIGYERPKGWSSGNPRGGHGWNNRLAAAQRTAGVEVSVPISGGDIAPQYADMAWDEREKIIGAAETEQRQIDAEQRVTAQFAIDNAITNAPAAIQNTGEYDGVMPTQDQFMAAYGDQAFKKFKEFEAAIETSRKAFEMQTMPNEEIQSLVKAAQPDSSGDDAALQQERYEVLSKAGEATIKAREDDPAAYVRRVFPSIDAAWNASQEEGGYSGAVAMSIAAQRQLGITDIKPLPKDAAEYAVEQFKDVNKPETERFSAVATALMATPDAGQRRAIFEQLVDAGLPDITEGAIEAMSRGDVGAARRLFQAATIDPSKLPGQSPEKPAAIDEAIQSALMDEGQVGDVYYGLSDGTAENFVRAERDSKLLTNAVNLRLRNGEGLEDAVNSAAKDLYGDVQVVTGAGRLNAQILVPADQDADAVVEGLAALEPKVRDVVTKAMPVPTDAPTKDGTKAILDAATSNYAENVLAEGYFRNAEGGFVFIDPYTGAAVSDEKGTPIIFTMEQVLASKPKRDTRSPSAPLTDDDFDRFQQRFGQ